MSIKVDIQELARLSGATDENGGRAEDMFCLTSAELDGFVARLAAELRAQIKAEADYRQTRFSERTVNPNRVIQIIEYAVGLPPA